ncbi:class I SAM-dependent methyltransferase [Rothia amarae]|uniref:class I SAM-dependent methyltransferase n=1 Tax=Rothia amarae TaxID=169480 RepID=UPI0031D2C8AC
MSVEHYFSSDPQGDFTPKQVSVELAGERVSVVTASGIFSPAGIDKGTAILLAEAPEPSGSTVLDIGTGWGPISLTLAKKLPQARVIGVEVNQRSAELTRMNAERLGLSNIEVFAPSDVPGDLQFDTIWSNPPIRVGKDVLHDILRTWLPRLAPQGCAYLVVQKNLGADSLQKWIAKELDSVDAGTFKVSRYATAKGFRILEVVRSA